MNRKAMVASLMLFLAASVWSFAGDGTQVKGMVVARTGETLIVSGPSGRTTVVLTDDTKNEG